MPRVHSIVCPSCGGDGGDFDDSTKMCDECNGSGRVRFVWHMPILCPLCARRGQVLGPFEEEDDVLYLHCPYHGENITWCLWPPPTPTAPLRLLIETHLRASGWLDDNSLTWWMPGWMEPGSFLNAILTQIAREEKRL